MKINFFPERDLGGLVPFMLKILNRLGIFYINY